MATLEGQFIDLSYKDLLQVSNSNAGIDGTIRYVEDGEGTASVLGLSTTGVTVNGTFKIVTGTFVSGGAYTYTFPAFSGTIATLAGTETFTNKTLTAPIIATISNTGVLTLPTSTDTLVGRATTDTLTNKTLTSPAINTATIEGGTVGNTTPVTILKVDNLSLNGNSIASLDTNGEINLIPNGSGIIKIGGGTTAPAVRYYEASGNGTNYIGLGAPAAITADVNYTLPEVPTVNGQVLGATTAGVMSFGALLSTPATQAEQETGTSVTAAVTPGRQQYHASAAKVWVYFTTVTTTAINGSYNVTSLTDGGTGNTTINYTTAFSTSNYAFIPYTNDGTNLTTTRLVTVATTSLNIVNLNASAVATDMAYCTVACYGDQ